MMHILIISSWYPSQNNPSDGIFVREQAQVLHKQGYRVGLISPRIIVPRIRRSSSTEAVEFPTLTPTVHNWFFWLPRGLAFTWRRSVSRLYQTYCDLYGQPDIIHAHNFLYAGWASLKIQERFKIPLVLTEHHSRHLENSFKPWQRGLVYQNLQKIDHGIAVSQNLKRAIVKHLDKSGPPWTVIPNMIDSSFSETPVEPQADESVFRFISVGNLVAIKRHDLILEALARVKNELPKSVHLDIVGDGELRQNLGKMVQNYGLSGKVTFHGTLTRPELIQILDKAHVFLSASRHETFGLAICEAMARGKPVIASASGGPDEFINDQNGLLVPVDDVDAFSTAILKIMNTYHDYNHHNIRRETLTLFSSQTVLRQLVEVYEEVLGH